MMIDTNAGAQITSELIRNYFGNLVNQFFKILPMRESEEASLRTYMQSLQVELLGCQELIGGLCKNALYFSLLSILQYLIDNPECSTREVKREVFKCIHICNKLESQCSEEVPSV